MKDSTEFTLQLVRATRENIPPHPSDENAKPSKRLTNPYYITTLNGGTDAPLPGEVVHLNLKTQRGEKTPVEVAVRLKAPEGMTFAEREARINKYVSKVDATVKHAASDAYRAFASSDDNRDFLRHPKGFQTKTIAKQFMKAVSEKIAEFPEMEARPEAMQQEIAERYAAHRSPRRNPRHLPDELAEQDFSAATPSWTEKIHRTIMRGNGRLH